MNEILRDIFKYIDKLLGVSYHQNQHIKLFVEKLYYMSLIPYEMENIEIKEFITKAIRLIIEINNLKIQHFDNEILNNLYKNIINSLYENYPELLI